MSKVDKFGVVLKAAAPLDEGEMALINDQALKILTPEEVFAFRMVAATDQVDRDWERFDGECLEALAPMFVGRPVLMDHRWSADKQTARIYAAEVERAGREDKALRLVLRAYMVRDSRSAHTISAIEGGILREVSVGCAVRRAICSICGTDKATSRCHHVPGMEYDGAPCVVTLSEPVDAYEVSFCAVPSQPPAGVVKQYGGEDGPEGDQGGAPPGGAGDPDGGPGGEPPCGASGSAPDAGADQEARKALALLELESRRY